MFKLIARILLAGVSLVAMTSAASAEPISLAVSFITSSFLAGPLTIGGISASQLALAAIGIGTQLVSSLFGRKQQRTDPGQFKNTFQASEGSELNFIGRCRVGGLKAFGNTIGPDRYRLILHSATPLVAIEEYYLGGRPVTVEDNGDVSSPPYSKPGGSWVTWKTKSGAGATTAWPDLMAAFPTLWTANHKAQGIAQSLVKYVSPGFQDPKFPKLYQGGDEGGAPSPETLGRFCTVYDPRLPECDPYNEETWVWSMNGPLCAARIMLAYPDLTPANFDWPFIAAEANKADVYVATKTGIGLRSQCSGMWPSEDKRGDTMVEVLRSIGAEIVLSDAGLIRIRLIDDAPSAEIAFTAKHVIDWDEKSGPDAAERPNVCRVKYYSPKRNYEMAEIDMTGIAWARIDDEVARYGEKHFDVELPFCPDASQAQRIARREFLLMRGNQGNAICNMAGMAAWGLTYGTVELDDLEDTPLVKFGTPRCDEAGGKVELPFTVWPEELITQPWNPATMEAAAPEQIPSLEYQSALVTPNAPGAVAIVQYADDSYEVRAKFVGVSGGTQAEAVYRTYTDDLADPYQSMTEYQGPSTFWYAYDAGDGPGVRHDFKCRFFNDDDEGSHFSDVYTVNPLTILNTTPAAPVINVDVTTGASGVSPWEFDVSVTTTDLHVALIDVDIDAVSAGTFDLTSNGRPEVAITGHYEMTDTFADQVFTVTAVAYTSNGTASATSTYTYTVPGTG